MRARHELRYSPDRFLPSFGDVSCLRERAFLVVAIKPRNGMIQRRVDALDAKAIRAREGQVGEIAGRREIVS